MLFTERDLRGAPVLEEQGMLQGVLLVADIARIPEAEHAKQLVNAIMKRNVLTIHADEMLDDVLEELTTNHVSWAPVVESNTLIQEQRVVGIVSVAHIMLLYRETQAKDSRWIHRLVEEATPPL
ncbi:MAG: hypothetical protein NVS4B11_13780 [Ktedonobacteraceae bacterium]